MYLYIYILYIYYIVYGRALYECPSLDMYV